MQIEAMEQSALALLKRTAWITDGFPTDQDERDTVQFQVVDFDKTGLTTKIGVWACYPQPYENVDLLMNVFFKPENNAWETWGEVV